MTGDGWIVIPGWAKFQHYPDTRRIVFVKDYVDQLDRDEYQNLTLACRGLLRDIRNLYARRRGIVPNSTAWLTRALGQRVLSTQLQTLNDAGWILFVASKPEPFGSSLLALARSREEEEEEEEERPSSKKTKKPVDERAQLRRAKEWIRNVAAVQVPPERLADVIADEFPAIQDRAMVAELEELASTVRERRNHDSEPAS